ncbi:MAG TPA: hypothetical protein VFH27_03555 [Longimicrobiaceae bacterium]|nr:hypothetical protein [Longimicrobiaceae bacterium]
MTRIEELIGHLAGAFGGDVPEAPGLGMEVTEVRMDLPVEARIVHGGEVEMSLPRGMLRTGFGGLPLGRLRLLLVSEEA